MIGRRRAGRMDADGNVIFVTPYEYAVLCTIARASEPLIVKDLAEALRETASLDMDTTAITAILLRMENDLWIDRTEYDVGMTARYVAGPRIVSAWRILGRGTDAMSAHRRWVDKVGEGVTGEGVTCGDGRASW